MKTLSLLRHAKSSWDDPVQRDYDRPLNARGKRAARTIGQWMARQRLAFDAVIASSATRVQEPLAFVGEGRGEPFDPIWDKRIYMASAASLFDIVRETGDDIGHLLLVGHNPGLEELLLLATEGEQSPLRAEAEEKYPTATFATLVFDVDGWDAIEESKARLACFTRPRDLDPELGPEA